MAGAPPTARRSIWAGSPPPIRRMPLPCYARVTNLQKGRSMVVRVNDRGPFVADRVIDVSARVANLLDFQHSGLTKVKVEYVGMAPTGRGGRAGAAGEPEVARIRPTTASAPLRRRGRSSPPSRRRPSRLPPLSPACADGRRRLCADAGGKRRLLRIRRAGGGEPHRQQRAGANGEPRSRRRRRAAFRRLRPTATLVPSPYGDLTPWPADPAASPSLMAELRR